MENTSYVLYIATSIIIAVMLIAVVIYVFNNLSTYQEDQNTLVERDNMTTFNESFEVYQKNLMYGTDVLSCLNKAENNNQKYVYGLYYGTDSNITWDNIDEYLVQVTVTLNSTLQEEISVTYKSNGSIFEYATGTSWNYWPFDDTKNKTDEHFKLPSVTYYYFSGASSKNMVVNRNTASYDSLMWPSGTKYLSIDWKLAVGTYDTSIVAGTYKLVAETDEDKDQTGKLAALLSTVTEVDQTIYKSTSEDSNWYSATWTTAVYDFKTRKFKCTGITYDEETGYVDSLTFIEVDT